MVIAQYSSCLERGEEWNIEFSSLYPRGLKPEMHETKVTTPVSSGSDEEFQFGKA
jgi:hypothetical protein